LKIIESSIRLLNLYLMILQSVGADLRAELEMQVRLELNKKLARLNAFLQQHAEECDKIDRVRDANEAEIRKHMKNAEKELQVSESIR
jgi:hypothetical protein